MKAKYIATLVACTLAASMQAQQVLTLEQCRKQALENNIKMRSNQLDIDQAREQEKEAHAKYLPTVTAGANYFHSATELIQERVTMSSSQQQSLAQTVQALGLDPSALASMPTSYDFKFVDHGLLANVTAMQPIYAGGRIVNGNKLAKLQTEVYQLQRRQSSDEVIRTTDGYYYQLVALYDKLHTLDAVDAQLESIHKDAKNAWQVGVANKNDMLSVELKQNEIATARLQLQNGISLCSLVLAQYLGIPNEQIMVDTTLTTALASPTDLMVSHTAALDARSESQLLDKSVEAAQLQTKMARGEMLPTVGVGVMGSFQNVSKIGRWNAAGLVSVSIPISNWWSSNHSVKRLKLAEQQAQETREDSRQLLLVQMQSALNDLDNAYKQVQLARTAIETSDENLRLNRDYYRAGTSTMSDLLDAQTQSRQARDQLVDATTTYLTCRTAYYIATAQQVQ